MPVPRQIAKWIERREIGVNLTLEGANICIWAPEKTSVSLLLEQTQQTIDLQYDNRGYWRGQSDVIREGDLYKIQVEGQSYPDPCSLSQPAGVHGASSGVNLHYNWNDQHWLNPGLSDYILYELHVGTFTAKGTFDAVQKHLDYLVDLGITAIELMPVAQFPGNRNWGYDGVYPFAVQYSYGGVVGLRNLIDACHAKGIAVVLDVVYNHLGPEGNYLAAFGPFFTDKYKTPWGEAINFDDAYSDGVRQFYIENVLLWFRDFHVDALRLDAVHAIKDFGALHILEELRIAVDALAEQTGRTYYLIAECDLNDAKYIRPREQNGYGLHAQWIDEFHHALRRSVGEPAKGYYADFNGVQDLAKAYDQAYIYNGTYSEHRKRHFGNLVDGFPRHQFIVFSQNHDQVGNRMLGERSGQLYGFEVQKLLAGAVLLAPYLPLLFMGEEYGETHPFLYFVDHGDPALQEAVRKGRKAEFKDFHDGDNTPDPVLKETFEYSRLQWELLNKKPHHVLFRYYQQLIRLRKSHPAFRNPDRKSFQTELVHDGLLCLKRRWEHGELIAILNFATQQQKLTWPFPPAQYHLILDSSASIWEGPGAETEVQQELFHIHPYSIHLYSSQ